MPAPLLFDSWIRVADQLARNAEADEKGGNPSPPTFPREVEVQGADRAMVVGEAFGKVCFLRNSAGNLIEFVERQ